ncbi:MAG: aspartate/glutamate racemase family protein, partial [Pseudodonghicola sp.]
EAGGDAVEAQLEATIRKARVTGATSVVLGCAGMSRLKPPLAVRSQTILIDGVQASAHLAAALC